VRSLFDFARSRDADFHVLRNGHELFGRFLPPNSGASYSNTITLEAGEKSTLPLVAERMARRSIPGLRFKRRSRR
jgi:hypothetical protein